MVDILNAPGMLAAVGMLAGTAPLLWAGYVILRNPPSFVLAQPSPEILADIQAFPEGFPSDAEPIPHW